MLSFELSSIFHVKLIFNVFRHNNLYFQNINLQPGTELREMWSNFPDPVGFKVYLFNVTNPTEIQKGAKPALKEVGPYVYE